MFPLLQAYIALTPAPKGAKDRKNNPLMPNNAGRGVSR